MANIVRLIKSKAPKTWFIFAVLVFSLFILNAIFKNKRARDKWRETEMAGIITDMAVRKNDKCIYIKLDSTWIWVGSQNPIFEKNSYLNYYFKKNKGEERFWLKKGINTMDSISFWANGADTVSNKNDIYWIEKERLNFNQQ